MIYDNTDQKIQTRATRTEQAKNRNALLILSVIVFALVAGFLIVMPEQPGDTTVSSTAADNSEGTTESTMAPAAGDTTATTSTTVTTNGDTATSSSTTAPATASPVKTYTTEDECRNAVNGACHAVSGGWEPVTPITDNTTVPEAIAPPMNPTGSSTSSETGGSGSGSTTTVP